jgi:chromosomal replication initiation ATPase DnaA
MEYTLADHHATMNQITEDRYLESLHYTHDYVSRKIAEHFNLDVADLKKKTRKRPIPECNFLIYFCCAIPSKVRTERREFHWSLLTMAAHFEKNHATILHGMKAIQNWMQVDHARRAQYQTLFSEMYADGYRYPLTRFNEICEVYKLY